MNRLNRRGFSYFLCLGLMVCLTVFSFPSRPLFYQPKILPTITEIRGVWLTNVASGVLFLPWGINRAINELSALKFNTIYPVVWNRGNTFYKSPRAKMVTGSDADPILNLIHGGQDVLAKLIKLAKPQGLSVIPWFEYGFMTPPHSQLARRYPDWLTMGQEGTKSTNEVPLEEINDNSAHQQAWLNPLHPEVQEFILGLIMEVVSRYDVDGIQLDDHFGMPVKFGYDAFTVDLYRQEHQGNSPPSDPFNPRWMRWRANKITDFMAEIYESVKAVKPNAIVSLSPNSQGFSYKYYLQDWETWVRKGLVDELILQVYRNNQSSFINELEQPAVKFARSRIPVGIGILTGTSKTPVNIAQIREQVETVRDRTFPGISFFYWESLWGSITPESPQQRRNVFRELFAGGAMRP
ncbi:MULTISPECIES: glycoside hydrolase family 10 protein [unclassified Nodularia (in: cyanobacteria)]|uniref:glycoside hydrolase family 10 protein n=1 Tax=unclassified Nodularia (in: cyanobacteria) TaxID=2656917 RepID=UPI001881D7E8|nr:MULTISPECIES: glycoside hydrolase family 10 protein [unclassified Nodularia (in: cyanobacteria)]MBE9201635.1 glycoside hydrolase family 10 protein [Nodularia sp. LEGE 06071]MCC2691897.1 glycoside hydrolase family 10 protein [Nodularia sp. LEGE 04288]